MPTDPGADKGSVARDAMIDRTLDKLRSLPGVQSAAITSVMPLTGDMSVDGLVRTDRPCLLYTSIATAPSSQNVKSTDFNHHRQTLKSILFGMKAVRIVAMALGAVIVLYLLVTVFLPVSYTHLRSRPGWPFHRRKAANGP